MTNVMAMSRELRRVPLDFDWPIDKTWEGYLMPADLRPPACEVCGPPTGALHDGDPFRGGGSSGDGLSPQARQLTNTWYAHQVERVFGGDRARGEALCWGDKLGQPEVDALIESGRFNPTIPCPHGCLPPAERGWKKGEPWTTDCPDCQGRGWTREQLKAGDITAAEVNASKHLHDGVNQWICIKTRCELLGFSVFCEWCGGDGIGGLDEQRLRYETWVPTEPPTGEGYQLWQTVSEGGPCSPVFDSPEALATWLAENPKGVTSELSFIDWLEVITGHVAGTDIKTGELVT